MLLHLVLENILMMVIFPHRLARVLRGALHHLLVRFPGLLVLFLCLLLASVSVLKVLYQLFANVSLLLLSLLHWLFVSVPQKQTYPLHCLVAIAPVKLSLGSRSTLDLKGFGVYVKGGQPGSEGEEKKEQGRSRVSR